MKEPTQSQLKMLTEPETIDIIENPLILLWLKEKAKREPIAFCRLIEENVERFERLYGPGKKIKIDENVFKIWFKDDYGINLFFMHGRDGLHIKIYYPGGARPFAADRKMGSLITSALEKVLLDLSGLGVSIKN